MGELKAIEAVHGLIKLLLDKELYEAAAYSAQKALVKKIGAEEKSVVVR